MKVCHACALVVRQGTRLLEGMAVTLLSVPCPDRELLREAAQLVDLLARRAVTALVTEAESA